MIKKELLLGLAAFCGMLTSCEPEKLERGKEMAVEAERHKVKRITQEDMEARTLGAGDTIVGLIEGAFLQMAEGQPKEQAMFVAEPDKLPLAQAILQRYNATLTRKTFASEREASAYLRKYNLTGSKTGSPAQVELSVRDQVFAYQRPIFVLRRNCASCDEPSLLNFSATTLDSLRVFSAQGKPTGYSEGQVTGIWQISFPRHKVIEQITLKTKPSRRGKGGFFGGQPDSTRQVMPFC